MSISMRFFACLVVLGSTYECSFYGSARAQAPVRAVSFTSPAEAATVSTAEAATRPPSAIIGTPPRIRSAAEVNAGEVNWGIVPSPASASSGRTWSVVNSTQPDLFSEVQQALYNPYAQQRLIGRIPQMSEEEAQAYAGLLKHVTKQTISTAIAWPNPGYDTSETKLRALKDLILAMQTRHQASTEELAPSIEAINMRLQRVSIIEMGNASAEEARKTARMYRENPPNGDAPSLARESWFSWLTGWKASNPKAAAQGKTDDQVYTAAHDRVFTDTKIGQ